MISSKRIVLAALGTMLVAQAGIGQGVLRTRERYMLRPGDQLELQYRLTPELNQTVVVQPDGYLNLNVAGEVRVGGLTVQKARELILSQETARLKDPELNLILKEFTRPGVIVAGEVRGPGRMEIKESMSALGAVMQAGGFTKDAKAGQVIVFRKVNDQFAEVRTLNLNRIKKSKDLERDMELEAGDVVYVPRDKIAQLQHYMSLTQVGMYFDPVTSFK